MAVVSGITTMSSMSRNAAAPFGQHAYNLKTNLSKTDKLAHRITPLKKLAHQCCAYDSLLRAAALPAG